MFLYVFVDTMLCCVAKHSVFTSYHLTMCSDKTATGLISRHNKFENCVDDWHLTRQPYFDDAYSSVSEKDTFPGSVSGGHGVFNESLVREGFLKFFVAILKNYKK